MIGRSGVLHIPPYNTAAGVTRTRIDQLYAPTRDALSWDHIPVTDDIFPRKQGSQQLDHEMIKMKVTEVTMRREAGTCRSSTRRYTKKVVSSTHW